MVESVYITDFIKPSRRVFILPGEEIYEEFIKLIHKEKNTYKLRRDSLVREGR